MTVWSGSQRAVIEPVTPIVPEFTVHASGLTWHIYGPGGLWATATGEQQASLICDLLNGERPLVMALMTLHALGGLREKQREEIGKILAEAGYGGGVNG